MLCSYINYHRKNVSTLNGDKLLLVIPGLQLRRVTAFKFFANVLVSVPSPLRVVYKAFTTTTAHIFYCLFMLPFMTF